MTQCRRWMPTMENSKIEWTDHTHNFWVGCEKVSPACDFCYAEGWAKRAGRGHLWKGDRERTKDWSKPVKWNNQAHASGVPVKAFANSLSDFFDNQAAHQWRDDAWKLIRSTPYLTWMILTKRPQNMKKMMPKDWGTGYPNVWLGVTAENQDEYNKRTGHLFFVPARIHFVSYEPALGPLHFRGRETPDWIICGGEDYERHGREFDLQWARDLRDECKLLDVDFFMKQIHKKVAIPPDLMVRQIPRS